MDIDIPLLNDVKYKEILNIWKCYACNKTPKKPLRITTCRHYFCSNCISHLRKCPKCGTQFTRTDLRWCSLLRDFVSLHEEIMDLIQSTPIKNILSKNSEEETCSEPVNKRATPTNLKCEDLQVNKIKNNVKFLEEESMTYEEKPVDFVAIKVDSLSDTTDDKRADQSSLKGKKPKSSKKTPKRNSKCLKNETKPSATPFAGRKLESRISEHKTRTPELEKRNFIGETPLHSACIKKDLDTVKSLLEAGANPNVKDFAGWTPLVEAVNKNNLPLVKMLLEHGAWVNTPAVFNTTPLLEAVIHKNKEIITLLLEHGADINIRSKLDNTPLTFAKDDEVIYNMLIKGPQKPSVPENVPFCPDRIPLICCDITVKREMDNVFKMCDDLNFEVNLNLWNDATHIVTLTDSEYNCECSLNVLNGILAGVNIVSLDWLVQCHKSKSVLPVDDFEVKGTKNYPNTGVPKIARFNAFRLNPKLFDGCHISLTGIWEDFGLLDFSKLDIINLIHHSGAVYLHRDPDPENIPEHEKTVMFHSKVNSSMEYVSHVILYKPNCIPMKEPLLKYNMKHVKTLPTTWFLKCIQLFSICNP